MYESCLWNFFNIRIAFKTRYITRRHFVTDINEEAITYSFIYMTDSTEYSRPNRVEFYK